MIPDKVWDILEERGIVPAPKLPDVGKIVAKAREHHCSVQLNYPADDGEPVFVIVTRTSQQFTGEAMKDVEAVAIALADCLEATEPVQMGLPEPAPDFSPPPDFMPGEDPEPKKRKRSKKTADLFDEVAAHLEAVGEREVDPEFEAGVEEGYLSHLVEDDDYPDEAVDDELRPDIDEVADEEAERTGHDGP